MKNVCIDTHWAHFPFRLYMARDSDSPLIHPSKAVSDHSLVGFLLSLESYTDWTHPRAHPRFSFFLNFLFVQIN
jgi:hypothetical protein